MNARLAGWGALAALVATGAFACSSSAEADSGSPSAASGGFHSSGGASAGPASGGAIASLGGRPPEREEESSYLAPVVTGKYLWTANPLSGRVALIDATTLSVTLGSAGDQPTQVAGLPDTADQFGALVLNKRSNDATLFRVDAAGRLSASAPIRTHDDANAWSVSPNGNYAVAWTDSRRFESLSRLQTFQDVTLIRIEAARERAETISVGARPSGFFWSPDERYVYAVTDEGISLIDLTQASASTQLISVSDQIEDPSQRDISFAKDRSFAAIRKEGSRSIALVQLPSGERQSVDLGGIVTDLDLDTANDRGVAALGIDAKLVLFPLPPADPTQLTTLDLKGERFGAVALNPDGTNALLYSTVLGSTTLLRVDLAPGEGFLSYRRQNLISPVTSLFQAPDARYAVAFQQVPAGSTKAGVFSLLSMKADRVPKIVATSAAPDRIAFSAEGTRALITLRSDALRSFGAYLVAFENQQTDLIELASPPVAAGVVPASERAFIAQAHPEGRITFVSLDGADVRTVTGFELSARIRE